MNKFVFLCLKIYSMGNFGGDIDLSDVFEDDTFSTTSLLENFENTTFKDYSLSDDIKGNVNKSSNNNDLNVSALCCDEEISGYDKITGRTWIYPTNYPVRDYQFNIIKASILKNTLVSLPTGLGKTFIAAVIMYNFYRWYPLGKIVFTAPTRPLVAQQIDACYNIIAIPPKDTIEMTGHMQVNTRKAHWMTKRVFFATPQVIYNDIKSGICPGDQIRCLVIDEAHRARGNYAYCQIVSTLTDMGHKTYRILALSATPGSKVEDVITVVNNLHIAHLELRTENCIDVAPYSHSRKISTVIVQLGPELTQLRQQYVDILDGYARRLKQLNILQQNVGNLSKGRIVMLYKEYQCKERGARHPQHNYIMKDFTILIALYHGLELLVKHGSRVFLNFFDEHPEKSWIQSDDRLTALLERLRDDLGINPLSLDRSLLPDGTIPEMPKDLCFGHPKFYKLKDIMLEHFQRAKREGKDTKAIVFCEYRESVSLVHCLLLQCRPLILPQMFVGQGAAGKDGKAMVSQKQQLRAMRGFRSGESNVLVATCVAEEGLDVGSVDLILCFDISTRSPIRLVQRCGRTGRERGGQVFILVTEGREHQTLLDCMRQRDGLNKKILQSKEVENNLYKLNPRMIPHGFTPDCQKMYITVAHKLDTKDKAKNTGKNKKGQKDLRNMLFGRQSTTTSNSIENENSLITEAEFQDLFPSGFSYQDYKHKPTELWCLKRESFFTNEKSKESDRVTPKLECQRCLQETVKIGHSRDTEAFVELLQYCDAKKSQLTTTQYPAFSLDFKTQKQQTPSKDKNIKRKTKKTPTKSPNKKDGDIRALFSGSTKSTTNYTKLLKDLGLQDANMPMNLINLLIDLNLENKNIIKKCHICLNICNCSIFKDMRKTRKRSKKILDLANLKLPEPKLLELVNTDTILKYKKSETVSQNNNNQENIDVQNCTDFLNDTLTESIFENKNNKTEENFDIGNIEDIFADSSPEIIEEINKQDINITEIQSNNPKETLEFFGLDSIEDIFADYDENSSEKLQQDDKKVDNEQRLSPILQSIHTTSPSILSGQQEQRPTSPILCSQFLNNQLNTKKITRDNSTPIYKKLKKNTDDSFIDASNHEDITPNYLSNNTNKTMFTVTQLVELINKTDCNLSKSTNSNNKNESNRNKRNSSPILLTQADKSMLSKITADVKKINGPNSNKTQSLIILDSDSESDDSQKYIKEIEQNDTIKTDVNLLETDSISSSPYFNKKPKSDKPAVSQLTLQEKVLAALTSNKMNFPKPNNCSNIYCAVSFPSPGKENVRIFSPKKNISDDEKDEKECKMNGIEELQKFRHDAKNSKVNLNNSHNSRLSSKRKLTFSDSDDDFVHPVEYIHKSNSNKLNTTSSITNHKARKKRRKNEFLDEEAELSDSRQDSGDELTDDSVGSIIDFICDETTTQNDADVHAFYLKSLKSPVKPGTFKIPQLPKQYDRAEILSQFDEEQDAYEADSFCVSSQVGLTQTTVETELEIAERLLEERRRKKRNGFRKKPVKKTKIEADSTDSPVIKRKNKNVRRIQSDSDDSS
ncbi:PREDICTED: Fanconi anemia group M protein isoform X2 [Papilio xuthus]|uniref:Fanconi anemia group M protein isoform X2 n=1 Tax=Papilio xuthus TaxID=66420 RepID=A0AAJ7E6E8_PAPXU|nr:PREDICTED: Fanconi anemia group M protein isoform X2 [Papilio xuthus]